MVQTKVSKNFKKPSREVEFTPGHHMSCLLDVSLVKQMFCNLDHFGPFFDLFTPIVGEKIKIFKNEKETRDHLENINSHKCTKIYD